MNSQESEKMDAVSKNAENNPAQENSSADEKNSYPAIPEDALIIIPVRNMVLFPGMVVPITIAREKSLAAAQAAMRGDRQIGVVLQKNPETADPETGRPLSGRHCRQYSALCRHVFRRASRCLSGEGRFQSERNTGWLSVSCRSCRRGFRASLKIMRKYRHACFS